MLFNFAPLSGENWQDKFGTCNCPAGDTDWIEESLTCKKELAEIQKALRVGSRITEETNKAVGTWWPGNVYTGFLKLLGLIKADETAHCDVVNQRTIKNAKCLLARKGVELKCFDLVLVGRNGKHMWTGIAAKGSYPKPKEEIGLAAEAISCRDIPMRYHDIWFALEPSEQEVTKVLPRKYCSLDVATIAESYTEQYCNDALKYYQENNTAGSGKRYKDIFDHFLKEER